MPSGFANGLGHSRREGLRLGRRRPFPPISPAASEWSLIAETPPRPIRASCPLFGLDDGLWLQHPDRPWPDEPNGRCEFSLWADLELPADGVLLGPGRRGGLRIGSGGPAAAPRTWGALGVGGRRGGSRALDHPPMPSDWRASGRGASRARPWSWWEPGLMTPGPSPCPTPTGVEIVGEAVGKAGPVCWQAVCDERLRPLGGGGALAT